MQKVKSVYAVLFQNNDLVVKQYIVTINIHIYIYIYLFPGFATDFA